SSVAMTFPPGPWMYSLFHWLGEVRLSVDTSWARCAAVCTCSTCAVAVLRFPRCAIIAVVAIIIIAIARTVITLARLEYDFVDDPFVTRFSSERRFGARRIACVIRS